MKENNMKKIAEIINTAIDNHENESKLEALKNDVKEMCSGFPLYKDLI